MSRKQANDDLLLESLKKSLEDLKSVRMMDDSTDSVSDLKESIRNHITELESEQGEETANPTRPGVLKAGFSQLHPTDANYSVHTVRNTGESIDSPESAIDQRRAEPHQPLQGDPGS
jgi:hypothetical protein